MKELWMLEASQEGKKPWIVFDTSTPYTSEEEALSYGASWHEEISDIFYTPIKFVREK